MRSDPLARLQNHICPALCDAQEEARARNK